MKVLHLRSGGGLYGPEGVILALSSGLRTAGHEAAVVNLQPSGQGRDGLVRAAAALGLEADAIACRSRIDFSAIRSLRRYMRRRRFDLIHSHDYKSDFYALICGRETGTRLVATCHNWAASGPGMRLYKPVDKRILRRFDRVAAVSEPLRNELLLSGIDGAKLVKIPNGVTIGCPVPAQAAADLRKRLGIEADEGVVVSVGRLAPEKGHMNLLAAARRVAAVRPRSRFLIAGEGPRRLALEKAAREMRLVGRVKFLGERRDVRELLAASDVFVLTSRKEGLPLALLEAMACRKPVIAAPVGEIPAVVAHGVSGLLVDPADAEVLAGSIIRMLDGPGEAGRLAEAGFRRVRDVYSAEAMIRRYLELYLEVPRP